MVLRLVLRLAAGLALYHTAVRLIRHFYKFPIPAFLTPVIDNPLRRRFLQPAAETAVRHGILPGMTVLEVGPGSGTYTAAAARRSEPDGQVVAIDIEPRVAQRTRRHLAAAGIRNASCHLADVYALPFAEASFDLIFMIAVIGELPDPRQALAEFHRVLRPEGCLVFSELFFDPDYPLARSLRRLAAGAGFRCVREQGNWFYYTLSFARVEAAAAD